MGQKSDNGEVLNVKVAIMQPYFFPYIGYWQMINAVDQYVVFNDVNYINRGWINRNRILCQGKPLYINIPLSKASQNKKINEIEVIQDKKYFSKLLHTLYDCYHKAPYFEETFEFLSNLFNYNTQKQLDLYLLNTIQAICNHLRITTPLILSSELPLASDLHGESRIIKICKLLDGDEYCNAIRGQPLYHRAHFKAEEIALYFLKTDPIIYQQFQEKFVENLSILDMMMFCSKEEIQTMLCSYMLV